MAHPYPLDGSGVDGSGWQTRHRHRRRTGEDREEAAARVLAELTVSDAAAPEMSLAAHPYDWGCLAVGVAGDLGAAAVRRLQGTLRELRDCYPRELVVELSRLGRFDASLPELLGRLGAQARPGAHVELRNAPSTVVDALKSPGHRRARTPGH